jgi:hypothetical protein
MAKQALAETRRSFGKQDLPAPSPFQLEREASAMAKFSLRPLDSPLNYNCLLRLRREMVGSTQSTKSNMRNRLVLLQMGQS